jgi:hypothetical protein
MSPMSDIPRRRPDCPTAGAPGCWIPANAGNEVAAAEAAPRIRMNDLRETPCVIEEFIKVLLDKVWFCRDAAPRRQVENRQLKIRGLTDTFCKNEFALQLLFFGNFVDEADRSPIEIQFTANFPQIPEKFL